MIETGVLKSKNGLTEFNLNTGTIRQKSETDEYTDYVYISDGRYYLERIYKKQDLTEVTDFRNNGLYFFRKTTSTNEIEKYTVFSPDFANPQKLALGQPLAISHGGTGADNVRDAQKNLGLEAGATRDVWWPSKSADSSFGTEDFNKADLYVPSLGTMMEWNGAYFGSKSNLCYCYKGLFGDLAVKNFSDTDSRYLREYALNAIDINNTDGCWTVDISEEGHGTIPTPWVNVTQTTSGHFYVQIAIKCDKDDNSSRKASGMWIRNKYVSSAWSAWTGVSLL